MEGAPMFVNLEDVARRMGGFVWVEHRLFEIVGAWVPTVPEPPVKVAFAALARNHAWRARELSDRLPQLREINNDRLITEPDGDLLRVVESAATTPQRLAGVVAALAGLRDAYVAFAGQLSPIRDASAIRSLARADDDIRRDLATLSDLSLAGIPVQV